MKKIFPILILMFGIAAVVGVFFYTKNNDGKKNTEDAEFDDIAPEVAMEKRPVVFLTPSEDGHWLTLKIQKMLIDSATLDYELTYKLPDGRTQGVPGTVKLASKDDIEKELLLGSESSGKFRYDEGVERGNVVLRFRDDNGKLVAKFETEFFLQSGKAEITTPAGTYTLDKPNQGMFYVSMDTIGYPGDYSGGIDTAFGIFTALNGSSGSFDAGDIRFYDDGEWVELNENKSSDTGFFLLPS
ncbi:MAG: hypothetical protein US75_C0014G0008 [Candidatus Woesebacteria bacterium GW2011_GWC1_38_13]|uniref:Uncharacterized protein n=3 Tax=Candidatus Woeseibacteriota TaxID=1752722 RepID=A0A0G0P611_9BACT|nr:MAG: hypothetical protein US67_C0010G0012 [Candidatus Woesebacteria bacterium GW2011_GWD1_38_10]KKQ55759.1 MAG: hypothetical protein US75_C0014G0008 [Candidatus Woesebacteria bacterium GW2011_GWC1_38_13]KKQ84741.1 MAG: hypothetical protein UT06_C0001G0006 [Candidatus Woesebacteria bacterium GW2011_GWA1_38_8]